MLKAVPEMVTDVHAEAVTEMVTDVHAKSCP